MDAIQAPTAIDLFSGMGGLTLGLKMAGFRVLGAVEIDALAAETYRANHGDVRVWESDIRDIHPSEILSGCGLKKGELALLAGCPPCQGYSTLRTKNRRRSVDDPRNDLVFEFIRFAKEIAPEVIMMENVPNLAQDPRIDQVLHELRFLGYHVDNAVRVFDAADYQVPQRRRRMIMLCGRSGPVPFAAAADGRQTVGDAFEKLASELRDGDPNHFYTVHRHARVMKLIRSIPRDGGSRTALPIDQQLPCHRRSNGFRDVYGRMALGDVAPTITSGCFNPSKGRFLHPTEDRAISLREAATLQSFPADYEISLSRGREAAAAMIGNALPPEFIRRQADSIAAYIAESEAARC